jgi:sn-glycerol 3-phosphate transport system permease protein
MSVAAPSAPARASSRQWRRRRDAGLAYLLLLPALTIFAVFVFFPFAKNFQLALYRNPPFPGLPSHYVGLRQITDMLTSSAFRHSLWTTVAFALMTVPTGILAGLVLAVIAHQRLRGIAIYRTVFSSTVATSVAVASVIFGTLMNPQVGLLPWLGLSPTPPFLQSTTWALPAVALTTVWQNLGLSFILMSAGLQAVPDDLLEAAQVDGAGPVTRFWRVTVPLLSPTIFFAVVVGSIFAFQTFGQIDLLTQGGPEDKTNVLTYFIVSELHQHQNPGSAAVLSIALFIITLTLTLLQLRFLERRVHYAR